MALAAYFEVRMRFVSKCITLKIVKSFLPKFWRRCDNSVYWEFFWQDLLVDRIPRWMESSEVANAWYRFKNSSFKLGKASNFESIFLLSEFFFTKFGWSSFLFPSRARKINICYDSFLADGKMKPHTFVFILTIHACIELNNQLLIKFQFFGKKISNM